MTDNDEPVFAEFTVARQGAPVVNYARVYKSSEDIALVLLDLATKRCEILCQEYDSEGVPILTVMATENSTGLKDGEDATSVTQVAFPSFKGWKIWMDEGGRYTFKLCFVRE